MTSCERAVKTINQHGKEPLLSAIMAFNDIEPMRGSNTGRCVLHIDIEKAASTEAIAALTNYGVQHIAWSEKEQCIEKFALN